MLSGSQIRSKEMLEREQEYLEKHMNSEVKTYKLSEEEIEKLYGKSHKTSISKPETVLDIEEHRWVKDKEGKNVRLNAEIIRKDILSGLSKKDIFEKYEGNSNIKSRLYNIAIRELIKENHITEEQAKKFDKEFLEKEKTDKEQIENVDKTIDKEICLDEQNDTQNSLKAVSNINALKVKNMDLQGKIFSYRVNGEDLSLISSSNSAVRIDKNSIGILIGELEQLKEMI